MNNLSPETFAEHWKEYLSPSRALLASVTEFTVPEIVRLDTNFRTDYVRPENHRTICRLNNGMFGYFDGLQTKNDEWWLNIFTATLSPSRESEFDRILALHGIPTVIPTDELPTAIWLHCELSTVSQRTMQIFCYDETIRPYDVAVPELIARLIVVTELMIPPHMMAKIRDLRAKNEVASFSSLVI